MSTVLYHGAWDADVTYGAGALVTSDGGLYLFTATQPLRSAVAPTDDAAHWSALVAGTDDEPPVGLTDTFVRPDQDGWGTASGGFTWVDAGIGFATGTASIISNRGVQVGNSPGGDGLFLRASEPLVADNQDLLLRWTLTTTAPGTNYLRLSMRATPDTTVSQATLFVLLNGTWSFYAIVDPTVENPTGTWAGGTSGDTFWTRLRARGNPGVYQWRTWADGTSEPATWDGTHSSAVAPLQGYCFIALGGGGATGDTLAVDSFSVLPATLPWTDDFSRPDQAGWGTASGGFDWNSDWGGDPAELSIVSGTGFASGGSSVTVSPTGYSGADQKILVKVARGGPNAKIIMAQRVTGGDQYYCFVDVDGTVAIRKLHSGNDNGLVGGMVPFTIGDAYWFSFQCVGTALEAKWWADGDPEPGSPTLSATDSLISAPGRVQMELPTFGGSVTLYSFTLTDLS